MRLLISVLLIFHGLIHFLGFVKAFEWAKIEQLKTPINKSMGMLWFTAAICLLLAAFTLISNTTRWWVVALIAIGLSQLLIILHWQDARFGTVVNVIILLYILQLIA